MTRQPQNDMQAELETLRQQIASLEQDNAALRAEVGQLRVARPDQPDYFRTVIEHSPDCIAIMDGGGTMLYTNNAFERINSFGRTLVQSFISDTLHEGNTQTEQVDVKWHGMLNFRRQDGSTFTGFLSAFRVRATAGNARTAVGTVRDVTEQVQAEKEQAILEVALQEQLIEAQQATIRELSTPIIPLAEDVVVMPLVGLVDSSRARQIFETLLVGIEQMHARVAIIDTTGVKLVDLQVAQAIVSTARATRLLGARVMLTGVNPLLAQSLHELGIDMSELTSYSTLQQGIAAALNIRLG